MSVSRLGTVGGPPLRGGSGEDRRERRATQNTQDTRKLGDLDSNQDKQYQKLLCYRYTIAQNTIDARCADLETGPP